MRKMEGDRQRDETHTEGQNRELLGVYMSSLGGVQVDGCVSTLCALCRYDVRRKTDASFPFSPKRKMIH